MTAALQYVEEPMPSIGSSLTHRPARGRRGLACWMVLPNGMAPDAIPLVAVHGVQRGAEDKAVLLQERAEQLGRPVIAPLFDKETWPHYQQLVRSGRADLALLTLMEELRIEGVWQSRQFDLFGHSGGAQFAHRFAMLYPHLVRRLTVGAAGWYTFPDQAEFPLGLARRPDHPQDDWGPRMAAGLDRFLSLPIRVYVGALDNQPDDNTRRGELIDEQQGIDRMTRAARWTRAVRQAAEARDLEPNVVLRVLPNCAHDFRDCVANGDLAGFILPMEEEIERPAVVSGVKMRATPVGRA